MLWALYTHFSAHLFTLVVRWFIRSVNVRIKLLRIFQSLFKTLNYFFFFYSELKTISQLCWRRALHRLHSLRADKNKCVLMILQRQHSFIFHISFDVKEAETTKHFFFFFDHSRSCNEFTRADENLWNRRLELINWCWFMTVLRNDSVLINSES